MNFKVVGKPMQRGDAAAKVTGKAMYTRDITMPGMLYAKILRAEIAHGYVKSYDISEAEKLPGVIKIVLPKDVKANPWPSAGHPYSLNPAHQDIADRQILNEKIRLYGDEIGAVVAKDELTAEKALKLIKVEYEVLPFVLDAEEAMKEGAPILHGEETNVLRHTEIKHGKEDLKTAFSKCDYILEETFDVQPVQHAHMENHIAYAYVDTEDRLTVVTSSQISHIVRRVVAKALDLPFGKVRVVQPYIGGGFGNKQDVVVEPMAAMLSLACDGRPVMVDLSREEVFFGSRTRHGIIFKFKTGVSKDGRVIAKSMVSIGNNGAYASHGHSIVAKGGTNYSRTYPAELATEWNGYTVYTNTATAGAMRGYGIPQVCFAVECHMDDLADDLGMDPIEFKQKNMIKLGFVDPVSGIEIKSCGLPECIEKGKAYIDWDNKRKAYTNQTGDKRKGIGFSLFSYATGVWPFSMELAGARLTMNQDGTLQLSVGAAEIGQGSDTVLAQMAAEIMGVPFEHINVVRGTDTDIHPYDPGAYASRQTYVAGHAVRQAAESVRDQVCARAAKKYDIQASDVEIRDAKIYRVSAGRLLCTLEELAMETFYEKDESSTISSEKSANVKSNALAFGVCVAEVEVDVKTGKVNILKICNIHDSGTIINPILATGQVEGGMSMSCGMALMEGLKYNPKTGQMLTDNLLDYKLPTVMDSPHFDVDFVEPYDETGPFGNKALGEPPAVPPAAAIRNAIKHATGVRVYATPMNPQSLFEAFREAGLN